MENDIFCTTIRLFNSSTYLQLAKFTRKGIRRRTFRAHGASPIIREIRSMVKKIPPELLYEFIENYFFRGATYFILQCSEKIPIHILKDICAKESVRKNIRKYVRDDFWNITCDIDDRMDIIQTIYGWIPPKFFRRFGFSGYETSEYAKFLIERIDMEDVDVEEIIIKPLIKNGDKHAVKMLSEIFSINLVSTVVHKIIRELKPW